MGFEFAVLLFFATLAGTLAWLAITALLKGRGFGEAVPSLVLALTAFGVGASVHTDSGCLLGASALGAIVGLALLRLRIERQRSA